MTKEQLNASEYHPYYQHYLNLIAPSVSVYEVLQLSLSVSIDFLNNIDKDLDYRYEPQKWSIGEVIMHNIDTERIFAYRALRFMRGDYTPLPGFDQDVFAQDYNNYAFAKADLIQSFTSTRNATIQLFNRISESQLLRKGIASDNEMSVRVIPFLIAGHTLHHEQVIQERYLS